MIVDIVRASCVLTFDRAAIIFIRIKFKTSFIIHVNSVKFMPLEFLIAFTDKLLFTFSFVKFNRSHFKNVNLSFKKNIYIVHTYTRFVIGLTISPSKHLLLNIININKLIITILRYFIKAFINFNQIKILL